MNNNKYIEIKGLNPDEVADLRLIVETASPGIYTLRKLYGESRWAGVIRKRAFGHWAKNSVKNGLIARMRLVGQKSNGSRLYAVLPEEPTIDQNADAISTAA